MFIRNGKQINPLRRYRQGLVVGLCLWMTSASFMGQAVHAEQPATPLPIQVGFSPEGSAEALVLDVIQQSQQQIRLMGYEPPRVSRRLLCLSQAAFRVWA